MDTTMASKSTTRKVLVPDLTPEHIRAIRERLGLSQAEAGELLGGGPRAFTKYEAGAIKPAASIANMLRLLDADPSALATLSGGRAVPIDTDGHRPFEVTGKHIEALTDRKLTSLARRLLAAEAQSADLPMDGIHVAASITAPDGGEDARIEWLVGPPRTAYLPARLSQLQLKATSISPSQAAREVLTAKGNVKPMVRSALEAHGAYVLLCSRSYTKKKAVACADSIRKALASEGLHTRPEQVQFRDADQIATWVNAHPPVAAWVFEQTQPGLVGPFRDWTHWAGRYEHERSPWVPDPRLAPFRDKLRDRVARPRGVARVVGLAGIGKSRLVLEALAPDDTDPPFAPVLTALVLYAVESEAGTTAVKNIVQNLADAAVRAIVVIDRCIAETHQDVAAMVKRSASRLSLITIDHDVPPGDKLSEDVIKLDCADQSVIDGMIKRANANLPSEDHRRLLAFAKGFPQMANLLGQAWLMDASIASATDDELFDRIIFGRKPSDAALLKEAGMLLGAFGLVGTKASLVDVDAIAAFSRRRSGDDLHAAFRELEDRGVVQRHGRLISLQPKPLAMALAERQWRAWSAARWDEILAGPLATTLRVRAARQLALLNDRAIAFEVVQHVCRLDGPFASLDALAVEGATEVLSALAEIDTQVVGTLLDRLLGPLSTHELKALDGNVRRHLVWALEKIAFRSSTFEQGAQLMLALAMAENETWGNNATGQFKALFPVFLGNTEASAAPRLILLDSLIGEDSPDRMPLVVEALLEGASTGSHSRTIGSEIHGSRPALKPWHPKLWKDAWDYILACLDRLAQIALRSDAVGERARMGMGHTFRSLVSAGLIDRVEAWVSSIGRVHRYWPAALKSLSDVLQYDRNDVEHVAERVHKLIDLLSPETLADRVRFLVSEMPWDYPIDEKLEFQERSERQLQAVEALARDLLNEPLTLIAFFPQLSVGQQRMSHPFGRAIAILSADPLGYEAPIKAAFESATPDQRNLGLLAGYYTGLSQRHPERVEAFKQEAVHSPVFAPTLPAVCASISIADADVQLICEGLRAGTVPSYAMAQWSYGAVLAKLPSSVLAPLFDLLLESDGAAYSGALDLIGMYVHGQLERLEELRAQLKLAACNVGRRPKRRGSQMDAHHFKEMLGWLLAKGWADPDARTIALTLARFIAAEPDSDAVEFIKPLLPKMLADFAPVVWPVFGQAIATDRAKAWQLEHALGDSFSFDEKKPAVLSVPEDILFAWCHASPDAGPAFLARIIPVLAAVRDDCPDRVLHPLTKRLLNEFGDRSDVLGQLSANMHTYSWSGSRTTYFVMYDAPLRSLATHPIAAVRQWAAKMHMAFCREMAEAKNQDEELSAHWNS
jgi:DNA-binding transcriptional regulator YiaG